MSSKDDEGYCDVTVQPAGETPIPCGLELPCPNHSASDYPEPRAHRSVHDPAERARIYLGEARDV
jgi:hypothetical protein